MGKAFFINKPKHFWKFDLHCYKFCEGNIRACLFPNVVDIFSWFRKKELQVTSGKKNKVPVGKGFVLFFFPGKVMEPLTHSFSRVAVLFFFRLYYFFSALTNSFWRIAVLFFFQTYYFFPTHFLIFNVFFYVLFC